MAEKEWVKLSGANLIVVTGMFYFIYMAKMAMDANKDYTGYVLLAIFAGFISGVLDFLDLKDLRESTFKL